MELCIKLSDRILNLETTKTAQAKDILSLKKKVKRLKKKRRSITHRLKRLYKVGLFTRAESFEEESLGEEDTSKQGRKITDIDADKELTLIDETAEDQGRFDDQEMLDTRVFDDEEIIVEKAVVDKEVDVVEEVNVASITTPVSVAAITTIVATTPTISMDDITLAKALIEIKTSRPKAKGIVMQDPSETPTPTPIVSSQQPSKVLEKDAEKAKLFMEFLEKRKKFFAAKRAKEKRNKPLTKAKQKSLMSTYLKNMDGWKTRALKNKSFAEIQELFDKSMKRINSFVDFRTELVEESTKKDKAEIVYKSSSKRAGDKQEQEKSKKQKIEDDKEQEELKRCLEVIPNDGDDVPIDATPLSSTPPTIMLKNFDREDLEALWRMPVDHMDSFLMHNLKTMFEHHVEDNVWKNQQGLVKVKNWKLYDSCGIHCVTMQNTLYYLLVEKMYPLTRHTLHQMFINVKLQVDYECEMAYELLRLVRKQLREGYVVE
nr:hypothetical protein [Tanacetum cinerariifolium]